MIHTKGVSQNSRRWAGLDVFRAVAILLVLILHFPARFSEWLDWIFLQAQPIAWAGVDLFFVLSGFLIANLLFGEFQAKGRVNISRFWIRRGFKIYPGFYFLIGLSATGLIPTEEAPTAPRLFAELFFVQNYFPHFWRHTWSLALEEHFYIAMALLFGLPNLAARVRNWRWIVAAIVALCLFLRWRTAAPFQYETHLYPTHLRIDSLFVGTFVAWLFHFRGPEIGAATRKHRVQLLIIGLALLRWGFWGQLETARFIRVFGFLLISIGCATLVALVVFGAFSFVPPGVSGSVFVWLGRISYATYLWHLPVLKLLDRANPNLIGNGAGFTIYCAGSVALGFLTTRLIEDPMLRLRDRLFPKETNA